MKVKSQPKEVHQGLCHLSSSPCSIFEQLSLPVAQVTLDGKWMWLNPSFLELIGFSSEDLVGSPCETLLGDDLNTELPRLLSGEITYFNSEKKVTRKDGRTIWLEVRYSAIRDKGASSPRCLLLLFDDCSAYQNSSILQQQVAGRLIGAQETERTRIARELHDDIGQRLAVLSMQMHRAGKPVSNSPGRTHPSLEDLTANMNEIAKRVSEISHGLHSSVLDYLGLRTAILHEVQEFERHHRIKTSCEFEGLPEKLDGTLGLSLFRVVQEALHNVAKHSEATAVSVKLSGKGQQIMLEIQDNGRGFDVEQAKLAAGLGLISMNERINLLGGKFETRSALGQGTTITATVINPDPLIEQR